jgi:small multidrug resistance pump
MWLWLAAAVVAEVTGTVSLRLTNGFSKLGPAVPMMLGYGFAFFALSQALNRGMALGVAYGVWAATGVALIAILGVFLFGEALSWIQIGGIALVICGVLALELGGAGTHQA